MQPVVLVIDDDEATRRLLGAALAREGYLVETAENGLDGLRAVERVRPALIILDINMPVMTGEVFARILSSLGTTPPVLVVSGEPEGEQIARQLGAAGYLAKPFNLQALLGAVQNLLGGAQAKPRTSLEW